MSHPVTLAGRKRKRHSVTEEDISLRLVGKFHHGFKEVRKSVKKARTFELQKLVKKLKSLRKSARNTDEASQEISDVEAQLEYLKRVDVEHIAQLALSSKIRKNKILSSNESLSSALLSVAPGSSAVEAHRTKAESRVESKLLSSKVLASEVDLVLRNLSPVLSPGQKADLISNPETKSTETDVESGSDDQQDDDAINVNDSTNQRISLGKGAKERNESIDDDTDHSVDDSGWVSGSIDGDSGGASDGEDGYAPAGNKVSAREPLGKESSNGVSTFLPSLSVGFIKGDSDYDSDEADGEKDGKKRKNRRGQRARQAIWEMKYGKNAKHVQKRRREVAQGPVTVKKSDKQPDSRVPVRPTKRPPPSSAPHSGTTGVERPLHPSWVAKQRLKEVQGGRIKPSQGRKLVFTQE